MIIGGINFSLHYRAIKGQAKIYLKDPETIFFLGIIIVAALFITFSVWKQTSQDIELSFRQAFFQVVAIITSTGYVNSDYEQWNSSGRTINHGVMLQYLRVLLHLL